VVESVDAWAMRCILYQLAFEKQAFDDDFAVLDYALTKVKPQIPSYSDWSMDDETRRIEAIVYSMLVRDSTKKPVWNIFVVSSLPRLSGMSSVSWDIPLFLQ